MNQNEYLRIYFYINSLEYVAINFREIDCLHNLLF